MKLSIKFLVIILLLSTSCGSCLSTLTAQKKDSKPKNRMLKDMLDGGFADFFNITEKGRKKIKRETKIHYKTGGFKEHIDIYVWINKKKKIVAARLEISRNWLQESLAFGIDVEKSFVEEFGADKEYIEPLVSKMWGLANGKEEELTDENLQIAYDVVIGKKMDYEFTHTDKQTIHFSNIKMKNKEGHILVTEFR
ncbi:MAG: hypothetical protein GY810_28515 [Aureispira sp.]|nr:hypothetical protein [Aureispira sp.]